MNPRQNASNSLKLRLDRVDSAVYVAAAEPALIVLVPVTTMRPSTARTCFSPALNEPTVQVKVLPSTVAPATLSKVISFGIGLVTSTFSKVTEHRFSTSSSKAIGPPSAPCETESERSCDLAGLVSRRSRRAIIRIPSTLYFML